MCHIGYLADINMSLRILYDMSGHACMLCAFLRRVYPGARWACIGQYVVLDAARSPVAACTEVEQSDFKRFNLCWYCRSTTVQHKLFSMK